MSAVSERITQDIRKINELSRTIGNRITIKSTSGNPINKIIVEINYPTAPSNKYPDQVQDKTLVKIELVSRYPFVEPTATITSPIFHPNVYTSGKICLGTKWLPTQGLDLLVKRIIQIITFDETILNEDSPANGTALSWYRSALRKYPEAFPTDKLSIKETPKGKVSWKNIDERIVINCPECRGSLRVKKGSKGNISCPKCKNKFYVET